MVKRKLEGLKANVDDQIDDDYAGIESQYDEKSLMDLIQKCYDVADKTTDRELSQRYDYAAWAYSKKEDIIRTQNIYKKYNEKDWVKAFEYLHKKLPVLFRANKVMNARLEEIYKHLMLEYEKLLDVAIVDADDVIKFALNGINEYTNDKSND